MADLHDRIKDYYQQQRKAEVSRANDSVNAFTPPAGAATDVQNDDPPNEEVTEVDELSAELTSQAVTPEPAMDGSSLPRPAVEVTPSAEVSPFVETIGEASFSPLRPDVDIGESGKFTEHSTVEVPNDFELDFDAAVERIEEQLDLPPLEDPKMFQSDIVLPELMPVPSWVYEQDDALHVVNSELLKGDRL